ncbi:hypothetical protein [uncultured Mesonia sp.]|uniref:hypothetical protein n=1 Tax=uncultured Mesonia sp. TaxID=399731 RepID=UPI00374F3869
MKKFLKIIGLAFVAFIALSYALDWIYTYSYKNPVYARDKVSWLHDMNSSATYDYALFGSSRCIYHLNPVTINQSTGLKGINLGYSGSNPFEIKLMVKKFLDKYQPKMIFVQLDNQYNIEHLDPTAITPWMPFIKEDEVYQEIIKYEDKAWYFKNIPFYRYTQYETKLGARNLILSYLKSNSFANQLGFTSINKTINRVKPGNYKLKDKPNIHVKEIEDLCRSKGVEVYFFTAPFLQQKINTAVIEKHVQHYQDFSQIFTQKAYFSDPTHLNRKGAEKFTDIFIQAYFD